MAKKTSKKTGKTAGKKAGKKIGKKLAKKAGVRAAPDLPPAPPIPAPGSLGDIVGQDRAMSVMRGAIGSGRVHHAWIFHGPPGVGKFTAALAFAAVILDPTSAPDLTGQVAPDPESEVQRLLRAGSHPDLHVIVKELARYSEDKKVRDAKLSTIPKDVIETHLLRPARLAPTMEGGLASKVFIVDEAELMDRSASNAVVQNAILKTLEEPPEGTVIVLVTSSEDRLLPTIRSRCQRVAFGELPDDAMHAWLDRAGLDVPGDQREWLMRHASGSPGRLTRALEDGRFSWHATIEPMLATIDRGGRSAALGRTLASLVDDWAKSWVDAGAKAGENRSKETANRDGARRALTLVADHYRSQLGDRDRAPGAVEAIDLIARAERLVATNVQVQFAMEDLSAGLAARASVRPGR